VVLIYGLGSDLRVWDAQFPVLAQHYRTFRYDIRGHGKSALPTSEPGHAHPMTLKRGWIMTMSCQRLASS
jgi:pimeloyl-ACP methyl ester carboxylesterase